MQDLAIYAEERRQSDEAVAELARLSAIRRQAYEACATLSLAARRSAGDLEDIKAGDIPPETVQAFKAAIAKEAEDLKEFFEERAGILEHDAGLPRPEAEREPGASRGPTRGTATVHVREGAKPGPVPGSIVIYHRGGD
jgi:hypothetical protein